MFKLINNVKKETENIVVGWCIDICLVWDENPGPNICTFED